MTRLALEFLGWALETFDVIWISILLTYLLVLLYILGIKALLVTGYCLSLVWFLWLGGLGLTKRLPFLLLAWCEVCALMSHQIDLSHLGGHLLPAWCAWPVTFRALHLFLQAAWPYLWETCPNLNVLSCDCLGEKHFIFEEKPNRCPWEVSWLFLGGYLEKANWVCTALYLSSNWLVALPDACKLAKSEP